MKKGYKKSSTLKLIAIHIKPNLASEILELLKSYYTNPKKAPTIEYARGILKLKERINARMLKRLPHPDAPEYDKAVKKSMSEGGEIRVSLNYREAMAMKFILSIEPENSVIKKIEVIYR